MITSLRLKNFKSFAEAELKLGPFTVLVGANASGKSNVRDAFRFLHGVARGYSVAEILGEKRGDGGELQWTGIRGGAREVVRAGRRDFRLDANFASRGDDALQGTYSITIDSAAGEIIVPRIHRECLRVTADSSFVFESQASPGRRPLLANSRMNSRLTPERSAPASPTVLVLTDRQPGLTRLVDHLAVGEWAKGNLRAAIAAFSSMRFLDLSPNEMRRPSPPGQTVLGDRGTGLSSVLSEIWESGHLRAALLEWLRALTPMDVEELDFESDAAGRVLVVLVEADGRRISALSASDGTLRFLALLAALLGPEPARFYFIEELENGIHPTRLHLLAQLIEQEAARGETQVIATTHSPQLLSMLNETSREYATLAYRLEKQPDTHLRRILDIPYAAEVLREQDLGRLHGAGWLEDAIFFTEDERAPVWKFS